MNGSTRLLPYLARGLALASFAPLLWMAAADAQVRVIGSALAPRSFVPTRALAAKLRPRHIPVRSFRPDLRGDTPESSKYYKITNLTAEVDGQGGSALGVNNDGRIAYDDDGYNSASLTISYIVNNGGSYALLPDPNVSFYSCFGTSSVAYALNENGEAVGTYGCMELVNPFHGYSAWSLTGATGAAVAYYDQRYNYALEGSYEAAINNHNVAVGCDGGCLTTQAPSGAALFEPAKSSVGRIVELRGLKGRDCYAAATGINDAGEIVGFACDEAVRFSPNGYAQLLFSGNQTSVAEAINQRGDVAGYFDNGTAILYRLGKTIALPLPAGEKGFAAYAYAINSTDEVVGDLSGSKFDSAFVYIDGHSYDLNTLIPPNSGWRIADAFGVNDRGEIVGDGYYNGNLCGISLKPPNY